jgi:hypothetical protein
MSATRTLGAKAEWPIRVEPSPSEPSAGGSGSGASRLSGRLRQPVDADLALRWMGSASEKKMTTENSIPARQRLPWNRGRLIGQKRPLKPKDVWTIRVRLQMEGRRRDLAMFNLAIDSKLRGCDLVRLRIDDVFAGGRVRDRATVIQKKTGRPVQFEITEQTRAAIGEWLTVLDARNSRYLFPSRFRGKPHLSTRQYARIVHRFRTLPHSVRKAKVRPNPRTFAIADEKGGPCPFAVAPRRPMNPIEGNPQRSSELAAANATSSVRHYPDNE